MPGCPVYDEARRPAPELVRRRLGAPATPTGRGVLAASAVFLASGYLLGYAQLTTIGAGCLLACLAALFGTAGRLDAQATLDVSATRVHRGEPVHVDVTLKSGRGRLERPTRIGLAIGTGVAIAGPATRGPGAAARFTVTALRRGRTTLGPPTAERSDPLGLLVRSRRLAATAALLVRPAVVMLPVLAAPTGNGPIADSGQAAAAGITFDSLREYADGDDIRHVHWPSSMRTGDDTLMVRQGRDPAEPGTVIVLDTRAGAYGTGEEADADFELAVDVAASVAVSYAAGRRPVLLVTSGGLRASGRGGWAAGSRFLDLLTEVRMTEHRPAAGARRISGGSLAWGIASVRRPGASVLIAISGRAADDWMSAPWSATAWCSRVVSIGIDRSGAADADGQQPRTHTRGRLTALAVGSLDDLAALWPAAPRIRR
jgi:uncharacterized protein (DUF58 family)